MSFIAEWTKEMSHLSKDPRTANYLLTAGPVTILTLLISYLYFCTYAGPKYMKNRKPYDLKYVLIVYNFCQVLVSLYLVREGVLGGWAVNYSFTCQPQDFSHDPTTMRMVSAVYVYYVVKIVELLDTIFFVLRKKQNQISRLHLYHHSLMLVVGWIAVTYWTNGHYTLLGVINSGVHAVMYTYYMLSAFGSSVAKYLWWKKYITIMQIVQFFMIFCHSSQVLFNGCNVPKFLAFLLCINSALFVYMFSMFYINAYVKPRAHMAVNNKKSMDSLDNHTTQSKAIINNMARNKSD